MSRSTRAVPTTPGREVLRDNNEDKVVVTLMEAILSVNPTANGEARRNKSLRSYILSHLSQGRMRYSGRNPVTVRGLQEFAGMGTR
jgi:hypothetical protein